MTGRGSGGFGGVSDAGNVIRLSPGSRFCSAEICMRWNMPVVPVRRSPVISHARLENYSCSHARRRVPLQQQESSLSGVVLIACDEVHGNRCRQLLSGLLQARRPDVVNSAAVLDFSSRPCMQQHRCLLVSAYGRPNQKSHRQVSVSFRTLCCTERMNLHKASVSQHGVPICFPPQAASTEYLPIALKMSEETSSNYSGRKALVFTAIYIPIQVLCVALRYLSRYLVRGPWGFDDILIMA